MKEKSKRMMVREEKKEKEKMEWREGSDGGK